jgi:hypothetical protein
VADDLGSAVLIARRTMPSEVILDFRLEHLLQHLQRPALQHLVQRLSQLLVFFRRLLDYSQHGWRLLLPAINRDVCLETHTKDTPPFVSQPIHNLRLYLRLSADGRQIGLSRAKRRRFLSMDDSKPLATE